MRLRCPPHLGCCCCRDPVRCKRFQEQSSQFPPSLQVPQTGHRSSPSRYRRHGRLHHPLFYPHYFPSRSTHSLRSAFRKDCLLRTPFPPLHMGMIHSTLPADSGAMIELSLERARESAFITQVRGMRDACVSLVFVSDLNVAIFPAQCFERKLRSRLPAGPRIKAHTCLSMDFAMAREVWLETPQEPSTILHFSPTLRVRV